jgi:hypothetical protein
MVEPLRSNQVKAPILESLDTGAVRFSDHARDELANDGLVVADALRVMRGGVIAASEFERGSWRYQIRSGSVVVVITFARLAPVLTVVVTAWKRK